LSVSSSGPEPAATATVFDGTWIKVDRERWPGVGDYEVVRPYDAVAVLPLLPDDRVVLVRQFRPPVRGDLVEIPAGLLDIDGEDALTCAVRELREETGYRHRHVEFLGGVYPSPGSSTQYAHLFRARTEDVPSDPPEEGIELVIEPLSEMIEAARSGRVRDAITALALLMAADRPTLPT
jgi:ADP-ribose pyrophosphatase